MMACGSRKQKMWWGGRRAEWGGGGEKEVEEGGTIRTKESGFTIESTGTL